MAYTTPTLTNAQTALSQRLGDPSFVRYTAAELTRYITEALRTWNACTQGYRDRGAFNTTIGPPAAFYDLPTVLPTLRGYNVTNRDLITDIQYTLLEPPTPTAWSGTAQFTLIDIWTAIQRRRDLFLQDTGAVLTRFTQAYAPTADGRATLPEATMTIRRIAWLSTATGVTSPVFRTDEWALNNFSPSWPQATQTTPTDYALGTTLPLVVQLDPPADAGTLDVVAVQKGASMDPAANTVVGIPDDWAWVIKYGALADLLGKDGLAYDPVRAAIAEARWAQGVAMAKAASVVLDARLAGVVCGLGSVSEADFYNSSWQSTAGTTRELLTAGHNLVACAPRSSGVIAVTLDVVRNMPVPAAGSDPLQIGADIYDVLLDYAQHLALWKEGAGEAQQAQDQLATRFFTACGITLTLQQASQPNRTALLDQTKQDTRALARELPVVN